MTELPSAFVSIWSDFCTDASAEPVECSCPPAAEAEAVTLGGHLATINNDAENTWVFNTFGAGSIPLWIGLTDQTSEGNFSWISGETPAFTKWSPGEPNDGFGDEEYGYIIENGAPFGLQAGFWNDAPNLTPNFPIYGVVEVPEPSALSLLVAAAGCVLGLRRKSRA